MCRSNRIIVMLPIIKYTTEQECLDASKKTWRVLAYASMEMRANKKLLIDLLSYDWQSFEYAHSSLRADKNVAMVALERSSSINFTYLSDALKCDMNVMRFMMSRNGQNLKYFTAEHSNRDFVILGASALADGHYALSCASEELRDDVDFVMKVVELCGRSLCYASSRVQNNINVVMRAVINDVFAFEFASEALRDNVDVVAEVAGSAMLREAVIKTYQYDEDYAYANELMIDSPFEYVSSRLQCNPKIVLLFLLSGGFVVPDRLNKLKPRQYSVADDIVWCRLA